MNDEETRACIQEHADALVRGDMDTAAADFSEGLRPQVPQIPQIAQVLPRPVTAAEVLSVDVGEQESVARIRYSGDTGTVAVRSHCQEQGGRPVIVHAEPTQ